MQNKTRTSTKSSKGSKRPKENTKPKKNKQPKRKKTKLLRETVPPLINWDPALVQTHPEFFTSFTPSGRCRRCIHAREKELELSKRVGHRIESEDGLWKCSKCSKYNFEQPRDGLAEIEAKVKEKKGKENEIQEERRRKEMEEIMRAIEGNMHTDAMWIQGEMEKRKMREGVEKKREQEEARKRRTKRGREKKKEVRRKIFSRKIIVSFWRKLRNKMG